MNKEVIIYSTNTCHYCNIAKEFFKEHGVSYTEYNVSNDPEKLTEMVEITGSRAVPVIVIDNEPIVGFEASYIGKKLGITV